MTGGGIGGSGGSAATNSFGSAGAEAMGSDLVGLTTVVGGGDGGGRGDAGDGDGGEHGGAEDDGAPVPLSLEWLRNVPPEEANK